MHPAITDTPDDLAERLDHLAEELYATGVLTDPAWRDALYAAPRHLFIPARAWISRGGKLVELDRGHDPEAWWDAVYTVDETIITQFNDRPGPPAADGPARPSSSCPAPNVQVRMLHALDLQDGMKVLEIGTGTGWNAALLTHRLGDNAVVTVEVDPDIADQAIRALATAGRAPKIEQADGTLGYPQAAPYDRVIATCAVTRVPYAWVTQTRPGGIILTPWVLPHPGWGGPLARLTVNGDQTASGRFTGTVGFMRLRSQRRSQRHGKADPPAGIGDHAPAGTVTSTTTINPVALLFGDYHTAFPALLCLGDGAYDSIPKGVVDGVPLLYVWLSDPVSGSWARVQVRGPFDPTPFPEGTVAPVEQYGPRRLWNEIEAVVAWWQHAGRPDPLRFGLTVTPDSQVIWLDQPTQPIFRLAAPAAPAFLDAAR